MLDARSLAAGLLALSVLTGLAAADQSIRVNDNLTIVVPNGAPVRFASYDKDEITAKFIGTFTLTGTYHIPFGRTGDYADPWFAPDSRVLATLPYWKTYRLKATHIGFNNAADFVKAVHPNLAKSNHGKAGTVSGRVAIKVDRYSMNITCDYPYYNVHFLAVVQPPQQVARRDDAEDEGC